MNLGNRHSQHSFAKAPTINMARSKFDRSYAAKDTFYFDQLTPMFCEEILPGDTINLNVRSFARLAPQVKPMMDNMYIDYFFFFVPNRLVWNNWERFNGAQDDPGDSTDYLVPHIQAPVGGFEVGSVYDHLGIPTQVPNLKVNALPFRAMDLCWNEWFRDQNLQQSLEILKGDGPDAPIHYALRTRAKMHDYFTSALPWPQKGDQVMLPLGTQAPVYSQDQSAVDYKSNRFTMLADNVRRGDIQANFPGGSPAGELFFNNNTGLFDAAGLSLGDKASYTGLEATSLPPYADLTDAAAASINMFRQAIMMQSLLERDARGGTRYVEILRSHFNVVSPDFRLQRPEFLSGGSTKISQHIVPQTSETATTPQANLSAFSTASNSNNNIGFSKSFVEHGYVVGFAQARADITYQQGLNKMWSRKTRWDYFWPEFQQLGEQAILRKEIYASGTDDYDDIVFGYQERYAEYRYAPSQIRGQFRSTFAESLDIWHLAEEFETPPQLNATFIQSNTPIERVLEITEGYPHLLVDYWFDLKHARPMMTYGIPATLGRF